MRHSKISRIFRSEPACEDMPLRVTLNEYVEISKYYSTPKSRSFVNGLLDSLIRSLMEEGEIVKTERLDVPAEKPKKDTNQ